MNPDTKEIYEEVRNNLDEAYKRYSQKYNLRARPKSFKIGDTVWKKNQVLSNAVNEFTAKLADKYVEAKVVAKAGTNTYKLVDNKGKDLGNIHAKDLFQ